MAREPPVKQSSHDGVTESLSWVKGGADVWQGVDRVLYGDCVCRACGMGVGAGDRITGKGILWIRV